MAFTFIDLFAGVGGFHAAMESLGGQCVLASEINPSARRVYENTWKVRSATNKKAFYDDVNELLKDVSQIPDHDVLCAGFPCQPFSKSGKQMGMDDARGTLFWSICEILEAKIASGNPTKVILLENVRNLAGPRHRHEWDVIIANLRRLGYRISSVPAVLSPHHLRREFGGTPQNRERVFIAAAWVGNPEAENEALLEPLVTPAPLLRDWDPNSWDLEDFLDNDSDIANIERYQMSPAQHEVIKVWNDFLGSVKCGRLPSFPIWEEFLHPIADTSMMPGWKAAIVNKNCDFYRLHAKEIDGWRRRNGGLQHLPPSRRKLEWQAQDTEPDLYKCLLHFRPSGIRAKRLTYVPALVAITQTSLIGPRRRCLTPLEAARLQGLENVDFSGQSDADTYRQLGNAVPVGVVRFVMEQLIHQENVTLSATCPQLVAAVRKKGSGIPPLKDHPLAFAA